jgi:DNA-binding transcriptional LysR family regulator
MVEHRHLRYFVAVAEELNFTRAADRLHMAQPPLSAAIRQLERDLGAQLLSRTTRCVALTDAGKAFLLGARRVLESLDLAVDAARRAAVGQLGTLRVAFGAAARFETLPAIGRAFRRRYPDVTVVTEEMWNVQMGPALRTGLVDVAVALCPELSAELACEVVRRERIVALLPRTHPRAGGVRIALGALAADPFVLPPRGAAPRLHDTFIELCRRSGFQPAARAGGWQSAWELDALPELGLVTLGPESLSRGAPDNVVALPIVDTDDRLETAIVTRAGETSPLVEAFAAAARQSGVTRPDDRSGSVLAFPGNRATARDQDGLAAPGRAHNRRSQTTVGGELGPAGRCAARYRDAASTSWIATSQRHEPA